MIKIAELEVVSFINKAGKTVSSIEDATIVMLNSEITGSFPESAEKMRKLKGKPIRLEDKIKWIEIYEKIED